MERVWPANARLLQTKRAKDTVPLVQKAAQAVLLSGTPMVSRPKEMLTQLQALLPEAKLTLKKFGERYCLSANPRFGKYEGALSQQRHAPAGFRISGRSEHATVKSAEHWQSIVSLLVRAGFL